MQPIEIIVIIASCIIVLMNIGKYVYRKMKHLPTGECASCGIKGKNLFNDYYRVNSKNNKHKEYKCADKYVKHF